MQKSEHTKNGSLTQQSCRRGSYSKRKKHRLHALIVILPALLVLNTGCGKTAEITERIVPQPQQLAASEKKNPEAEITVKDRILAAIIVAGDTSWFFKMSGEKDSIQAQFPAFMKLMKSVVLKENSLEWVLPEGWVQTGGETEVRYATLAASNVSDAPQCSITRLPTKAERTEYVLINVNRWRKQLQLPQVTLSQLLSGKEEYSGLIKMNLADNETAFIVNLAGELSESSGMPPFMSMMKNRKDTGNNTDSPNTNQNPTRVRQPAPELKYSGFDGWKELPSEGFRIATFIKEDNEFKGLVTVVTLNKQMGDLLENVNIWNRQLSKEQIKSLEDLDPKPEKIKIFGTEGDLVLLHGKSKADADFSILAAIVVTDEDAWFFKMIGDKELVVREKKVFESFLKTVSIK